MKTIILIFISLFWGQVFADNNWGEVSNKDGVSVFLQTVAKSDFKRFKAVALIKVNSKKVMSALTNNNACKIWKIDCELHDLGKNHYLIVKDLPWPLSDRYSAYTSTVINNKLVIKNIKIDQLPVEQKVRLPRLYKKVEMAKYQGFWLVEELEPTMTRVTYQLHSNPAGNIPKTMVNANLAKRPHKTLTRLKTYLEN